MLVREMPNLPADKLRDLYGCWERLSIRSLHKNLSITLLPNRTGRRDLLTSLPTYPCVGTLRIAATELLPKGIFDGVTDTEYDAKVDGSFLPISWQ
jgi:hypothetical protein